MAVQKQDDQHEHTFSNYVRVQDVVQKTCLRRWTIGKMASEGQGYPSYQHDMMMMMMMIYIYIYIYINLYKQIRQNRHKQVRSHNYTS